MNSGSPGEDCSIQGLGHGWRRLLISIEHAAALIVLQPFAVVIRVSGAYSGFNHHELDIQVSCSHSRTNEG